MSGSLLTEASATWARLLERSVRCALSTGGAAGLDRSSGQPLRATAGLDSCAGPARLVVDTSLLAGVVWALAGRSEPPVGPVPLSPAEEGLFAYLVLAWLALLPEPIRPRLAWIHGGDPDWGLPAGPTASSVSWRLDLQISPGGSISGGVHWVLPVGGGPLEPTPERIGRVPIPLRVESRLEVGPPGLVSGNLLYLPLPGLQLVHAGGVLFDLELAERGLRLRPPSRGVHMTSLAKLPVPLVISLGELVLEVAEIAALAPGQVLPLRLDDPPTVTLTAGGRPVARGVLVDDEGTLAVQLTSVPD